VAARLAGTGRSARGCRVPAPGAAGEAGPCPRPARWSHVELPACALWPGAAGGPAEASGGDPLTLALLFGLSDPTAIRCCAERGPLS
jgi:hypothetical protein